MIKPLRGYVLIEPEKADEKSSGGVYLPERSQDKPAKGKVIDSSNIFTYEGSIMPLDEKTTLFSSYSNLTGKTVYFKKWTGSEIKEDGKEYVFIKFDDLLGVVE